MTDPATLPTWRRTGGPLPVRLKPVHRRLWAAQPRWIQAGRTAAGLAAAVGLVELVLDPGFQRGTTGDVGLLLVLAAVLLNRALQAGLVAATAPEAPYRDDVPAQVARAGEALRVAAGAAWVVLGVAVLALVLTLIRPAAPRFSQALEGAQLLCVLVLICGVIIARGQQLAVRRVEVAQGLRSAAASRRRRLRRAQRRDQRRAREALLPLVRVDWPRPQWAAPTPRWDGAREHWVCYARLHQLAAGFLVGGIVVSVLGAQELRPFWPRIVATVMVFCIIVIAIALLLAHALSAAVAAAPPGAPDTWRSSRERALSLARIQADARNFLVTYLAALALALLIGLIFFVLMFVDIAIAIALPDHSVLASFDTWGAAFTPAVAPYTTGVLSLLTLGALAWVSSAYKELAVLRAEVAHRTHPPQKDQH